MSGHRKDSYSHLHTLVVEDNVVNQKVITAMLNHFDIKPDVAENGIDALQKVQAKKYDIIFMDCQMPEMDGFEVTRIIRGPGADRGLSTDKSVTIVAMTANTSPTDIEACYESGMDDFISKPVELDIILNVLEKWHGRP